MCRTHQVGSVNNVTEPNLIAYVGIGHVWVVGPESVIEHGDRDPFAVSTVPDGGYGEFAQVFLLGETWDR